MHLAAPVPAHPHVSASQHHCRCAATFAAAAALLLVLQILVFCCAHADQIKAHLADSKWLKQRSPRVSTVLSTNCLSLGEALRALDQKDIIKGTFILVSGVCGDKITK
jgi:hypothetical protein